MNSMLPQFAYKTSSETVTSSTTLQDDNELFVPVVANAVYFVELLLLHDSATAGDIKIGWTVPTSATFNWGVHGAELGTTSSGAVTEVVMSSRIVSEVATFGGGASTGCTALAFGTLTTSATAGNLQLQWAQGTSSGTASTVRVGSVLKATRMA